MSDYFLPFLIALLIIAAVLRDNFVFTLLYLFAGIFFFGRWWSERAMRAITYHRTYTPRAFFGEEISIALAIENTSWLPVIWLRINEGVPLALSSTSTLPYVFSLGPKGTKIIHYQLAGKKRGYYPVGPLFLTSGDVFGFWRHRRIREQPDYLTVYPKIIPLANVNLPSRIPLGSIAYNQPIYEDPNRFIGKRDYVDGDSLRRVDWKTTANRGELQVKVYEPSISIEMSIFLSLNPDEFYRRRRYEATELAIVVAASIANWVVDKRQAVGLVSSGTDPLSIEDQPIPIPSRKGRGHLMRILETLARLETSEQIKLSNLVRQESYHCAWGTTLLIITGYVDDDMFDELLRVKRRGLSAVLVLVDLVKDLAWIKQRANQSGVQVIQIYDENDLKNLYLS